MDDLKKLTEQNEALQKEVNDLKSAEWDKAYSCHICGNNVNYTFIMPTIKRSGLCPDCYWKDEE